MIRALLCLVMIAVQLVARQEACCRPPDEVANSPVPPLKQAPRRQSNRAVRNRRVPTAPTYEKTLLQTPPAASVAPGRTKSLSRTTPAQQDDHAGANTQDAAPANSATEKLKTWNSPDMLEARTAVMEFCRRAARTSPAEGQEFLTQLSQLPPEEMRLWLERFQARRMDVVNGRELEGFARQLQAEYAISRLETKQQAAANGAAL